MIFKRQSGKILSACLIFVFSTSSAVVNLRAHDVSRSKTAATEDIEAHRKTDFGFTGFDQLNRQLQKDFNDFDYAASTAAYRNSLRLAAAAADSHLFGQWSPVISLPVVPIHVAILPNQRVLMWDSVGDLPTESYEVHDTTRAIVWNPADGTFVRRDVNTGFNIFCAGHAALPNGKQFIAGGNLNSNLDGLNTMHTFDSTNSSWSMIGRMNEGGRWYPSVTALANGEMLITSGGPVTSEVYGTNGAVRSLTNAVLAMPLYPWLTAAPNGRAFYFGPDNTLGYMTTSGSGAWQYLGERDGFNRTYGSYAMYDAGKILATGGGDSTAHTVVININGTTPSVTRAGDLNTGRRQHNLTVLPDGKVLATGGNYNGESLVDVNAGVYTAELWDPANGRWQPLSSMQRTRQYHSTAALLPDGRVLVGGGGICGACYNQNYLEKNFEIFSPPYLFKTDGSGGLATRPTILSAPSTTTYRDQFNITTEVSKNVRQVVLIRPSSVTHSVNFEQRRIPLSFSANKNGIRVTAPNSANSAPPGYYMLFIIDAQGVPSVAKMIKLG
ncbi:MAG TPA: galactose oxidase-like domain-containing protein [Pyrinomonadaceae bacterium]|jgi:hypothetical protein